MEKSGSRRPAIITPTKVGRALGGHLPPPGAKIGLLGGSFNPAHQGHLQISLEALRRLGLDEVWWLVSPQNPLKPQNGMAPLSERVTKAQELARHPKIRVTPLESLLNTQFTADTLRKLRKSLPKAHFVWLLGADNLYQLEKWHNWQQIFDETVVAIFDRPSYALRALAGKAARTFASYRMDERSARRLARSKPPAWVFLHTPLNPLSATQIRSGQVRSGQSQFL